MWYLQRCVCVNKTDETHIHTTVVCCRYFFSSRLSLFYSYSSSSFFFCSGSSSSTLPCLSVFLYAPGASSLCLIRHLFAWACLSVCLTQLAFLSLYLSFSPVRSMLFRAFFTIINRENCVKKKEKEKWHEWGARAFAELARRVWIRRFSSSSTTNTKEVIISALFSFSIIDSSNSSSIIISIFLSFFFFCSLSPLLHLQIC